MSKTKKKPDKKFSHVETDKLRMTFIENTEAAERLKDKYRSSKDIVIKLGEYLNSDDPVIKDVEMVLQGFVPLLDHAGDEVMYYKVKHEDKTILYHLTPHPDALKALREISREARKRGFALLDSKVHMQQAAEMLRQKFAGTLRTKSGTHPGMKYVEKDSKKSKKEDRKP